MSKKCRAYSESKLDLEPADNRKAFYAGWEAAIKHVLINDISQEPVDETPKCKDDPRAPHGFDRNASHSADRYVCECEGWEPPEEKNT